MDQVVLPYIFSNVYMKEKEISKVERMYFLSMMNVVNDQGFEEWEKRGALPSVVFDKFGEYEYCLSFDGSRLRLILNSKELRYYLEYDGRQVDMFLMDSWDKIDGFIEGNYRPSILGNKID